MEQMLICLSIALIAGLLMSRLAKAVNLPAVTSYLVAGLLLGPFVLGRLGLSGLGIGFGSLEQVEGYGVVTQVALGFIAFVIGNEFRLSSLRSMGQQAITVGIAQAVITTALVDVALVGVHLLFPQVLSLASAITLGSIAAATAPAATLMVVKQYKAKGPLTHLLLMVVAIDDAVGLVLFSASYGVANALEQGHMDLLSVVVEPLMEILLSLLLGAVAGYLLNLLEIYFHSRSKRMSLSVAFVLLTVGVSMLEVEVGGVRCGFSLLLVCMMTGTVFCNVCPTSEELMDRLDRWVSPINILFFVLSGAELDLTILSNPLVLLVGVVYIASRSLGKISGAYASCRATKCSPSIQKYLGITLLPQAGVALGMAAEAAQLSDGHMVRNVVLFSVLVYELVGPTLTRMALTAAGGPHQCPCGEQAQGTCFCPGLNLNHKTPRFSTRLCLRCGKPGRSSFLVPVHGVGGKHGFVLPPHRLPGGQRPGHIQQPLVAAAAEAQGDVVLCLHEFTVHQHIQQLQQLIGHLAPGGAGLFAGELLPGVAGVAPDCFVGVQGLEVAHKGQQLPLVFRLKGLAAQQGQPGNVVRLAGGEHLIAGGLVEGLAVGKIPGHGVEAAGAAVAAAGNKYAGAHAGPVGNVVILDGCVVHSDTPIKSSPSRGSWQCEALTERVTDAARGP